MRVIAGQTARVPLRVTDDDGHLVDPDGQEVEFTIVDYKGEEIASGEAERRSQGAYVAEFDAPDQLDYHTVEATWQRDGADGRLVDSVEAVGRPLVPLDVLRQDDELRSLSAVVLRQARDTAETWFREAIGRPVVPEPYRRVWRLTLLDSGVELYAPDLVAPLEVYSIEVDGDEVRGEPTIVGPSVELHRDGHPVSWPVGLYSAHLAHGIEHAPADLVRAGAVMVRYLARQHNHPERAREVMTEGAQIVFSIPGPERPTGLPEVDAVVTRYRTPDTGIVI